MNRFPILLLILAAFIAGQTRSVAARAGTTAFPFLDICYDARTAAMGGASLGLPADLYGVRTNPAVLGYLPSPQLTTSYVPYFLNLDLSGTQTVFGMPLIAGGFPIGVMSGSFLYFSAGALPEINEAGINTGIIWHNYSMAGALSWSRIVWETFSIGATIKAMNEPVYTPGIYYATNGMACDLGAQYRLDNSRIILGMAVRNLGLAYSAHSSERLSLPTSGAIGISYVPASLPSSRLAADLVKATDDFLNCNIGMEADIYRRQLFLRGGYTFSSRDVEEALNRLGGEQNDSYRKTNWNGLSLGLGLSTMMNKATVAIDAAYVLRADMIEPAPCFSALITF
jgi:hypothetical protein